MTHRARRFFLCLIPAVILGACDNGLTESESTIRLEVSSSPRSIQWSANVGDEDGFVTIDGTTPHTRDFPNQKGGFGATVRKQSSGIETMTVCLTNLDTGDRKCDSTSAQFGVVALTIDT